jgi:hypothetical protein
MTLAKPYGPATIYPWPICMVQVQYMPQPSQGTINLSADIGWPVWIGPLSCWVAHVVQDNSTEKCVGANINPNF